MCGAAIGQRQAHLRIAVLADRSAPPVRYVARRHGRFAPLASQTSTVPSAVVSASSRSYELRSSLVTKGIYLQPFLGQSCDAPQRKCAYLLRCVHPFLTSPTVFLSHDRDLGLNLGSRTVISPWRS